MAEWSRRWCHVGKDVIKSQPKFPGHVVPETGDLIHLTHRQFDDRWVKAETVPLQLLFEAPLSQPPSLVGAKRGLRVITVHAARAAKG